MIKVTVKHENSNGKEFGYGIYVNAYVSFFDDDGDIPLLYASERVPFGKNAPDNLKKAEKRVRAKAQRRAKKDWVDGRL